jgi:hypothetical protein
MQSAPDISKLRHFPYADALVIRFAAFPLFLLKAPSLLAFQERVAESAIKNSFVLMLQL